MGWRGGGQKQVARSTNKARSFIVFPHRCGLISTCGKHNNGGPFNFWDLFLKSGKIGEAGPSLRI